MTVLPALIKTRCPEFVSLDDTVIQAAIDEAELSTNRTHWGSKADQSVVYLAAHILTMDAKIAAAQGAQARGPITSETIGPLSWTYQAAAPAAFSDAWYTSSEYGKAYTALLGSLRLSRAL